MFRSFNRTYSVENLTVAEYNTYTTQQDNSAILPLVWVPSDELYFDNFAECYNDHKKKVINTTTTEQYNALSATKKTMYDFFNKGGFDFLSALESDFQCASLCKVPLFYITQSMDEGRPTQTCVQGVIKGLSHAFGLAGICTVLTGVMLLLAAVGSFPLCCARNREEDYMDKEDS